MSNVLLATEPSILKASPCNVDTDKKLLFISPRIAAPGFRQRIVPWAELVPPTSDIVGFATVVGSYPEQTDAIVG